MTVAVILSAALLLTGCGFWDWLAGRPISQPVSEDGTDQAAAGPIAEGDEGEAAAGQPDQDGQEQDAPGTPPDDAGAGDEPEPQETPASVCARTMVGTEPSPGPFETVPVEPVDESDEDASFAAFRSQLLETLRQRDVEGLLAVVDPQVKIGFGGNDGVEAFKAEWGLNENPQDSAVWTVLQDILELGGVFTDSERTIFMAPYVYALYNAALDPFTHSVIVGDGVNVRAEPSLDAQVLDRASHVVVRLIKPDAELPAVEISGRTYCWARIQLPSGEIGYVADKFLWSPVGYRAAFNKSDAGWRLTFLVAGD